MFGKTGRVIFQSLEKRERTDRQPLLQSGIDNCCSPVMVIPRQPTDAIMPNESSRKRRWITGGILLFWAVMSAWLIRFEAFPNWFAPEPVGYRNLLEEAPAVVDSWMHIFFLGRPIGFSNTRLDTRAEDPAARTVLTHQTVLRMNVLGQRQQVSATAAAELDAWHQLQRFTFNLSSGTYRFQAAGRRVAPSEFEVHWGIPPDAQTMRLDLPDDVILYSPLIELSLKRMQPGDQIRLKTLDPVSFRPSEITVVAEERGPVVVAGRTVDALALRVNTQGLQMRAWMDADGRLVRQETPFGWVMEAGDPETALVWLTEREEESGADLLHALAVPCTGVLTNPASCRRVKLRLTGLASMPLSTRRQQVARWAQGVAELTVWSENDRPAAAERERAPTAEDRSATPFLQSDHPEMVRQVGAILEGRRDPRDQARAIFNWVHTHVVKKPTASIPSALDVLRRREGDCNEHTALFVALARAAGLPAVVRVGLLYQDGLFYYHAWPAVFAGDWLEMDPTLGLETLPVTHVTLLEGELPEQLPLIGLLGQLRAEVVDQEY